MLKMRQDMHLKCLNPPQIGTESFFERINANYNLLGAEFKEEELLHLVTSAPEVYLEEGNISTLVENNINNKQEVKVELINNLLNRIVAYQNQEFSYQDTVYVSSILKKLGITNVNEFMKQVKKLQTEQDNINNLANIYESKQTYLKEMGKIFHEISTSKEKSTILENKKENFREVNTEYVVSSGEESKEESQTVGKDTYYLHSEVLKRLETSKIFEEVAKHYMTLPGYENIINQEQVILSEHTQLSKALQVQEYRNQIKGEDSPIFYYKENIYEEGNINSVEQKTTVEEQIASALLLNLQNQMYQVVLRQNKTKNEWHDFSNALYQTSQNTLQRMQEIYTQNSSINEYRREFTEQIRQENERELTVLEKILSNDSFHETLLTHRIDEEIRSESVNHVNVEEINTQTLKEMVDILNQSNLEEIQKIYTEHNTDINNQNELTKELIKENRLDAISTENNVTNESFKEALLEHKVENEIKNQTKENIKDINQVAQTSELRKELTKELRQENERNLTSTQNNILNENFIETKLDYKVENDINNESNTHVNDVDIMSFTNEHQRELTNEIRKENERKLTELEKILSKENFKETKLEHKVIEEKNRENERTENITNITAHSLKEQLDIINQNNIERQKKLTESRREIRENVDIHIDREKALQDSLKAISRPEEMLLEYLTDDTAEERLPKKPEDKKYDNLDPQTKTLFQMIDQYKTNPEVREGLEKVLRPAQLEYYENEINTSEKTIKENEAREIISEEIDKHDTSVKKVIDFEKSIFTNKEKTSQENRENINFVHKQDISDITEELLEALEEQKNMLSSKSEITNTIEHVTTQNNTVIEERRQNITTNDQTKINEIVQRSMDREIGQISDKVYKQIEKKLSLERKRRGY